MNIFNEFFDLEAPKCNIDSEKEVFEFLKRCDEAYYNEGNEPIISDKEYDELVEHAQKYWPTNSYFEKVGTQVVKGKKVKHDFILGSLTKYKIDNVENWSRGREVFILPKFDGLSIFVEYNEQGLVKASTRGNGLEGQDISDKAKEFVPNIQIPCCLRGEIILEGNIHEELGFANRRNGASGIIGRQEISKDLKYLKVIFYEVISPNMSLEESFVILDKVNEIKLKREKISSPSSSYLIETLASFKESYNCDLDGLVLIDKKSYTRENVYYPKNKICFKYTIDKAIAIVDTIS